MERETSEQSYYPAQKIRLIIRFEEFGKVELVAAKAPKTAVHRLKGTKSTRGALTVQQDPDAPAGVKRLLLVPASGGAAGGPQKEDASADGLTWVLGGIIPRTASWKQNGIRTADELSAEMKFVDLPFDPRCIRTVAVEYYLGCLREEDYRAGVGGGSTSASDRNGAGQSLLVLPDEWVDELGRKRSNLRFQGWVDEWENSWPEDAAASVTIKCRDNTKVLIDQDSPPKLALSADKPIDEAIAAYLSNFPQFAGLSVQYLPAGVDPPRLGQALAKTAFRPQLGPIHTKAGGTTGTFQKVSVWDYLTDVCGALGHVVRVQGTTVLIQRARTITSNDFGQRPDDTFTARDLGDGLRLNRRHFIYGRNVLDMKVARRYGKQAPQNIEVRCFVPETTVEALDIRKGYRRWYDGSVTTAVVAAPEGTRRLTGTPNHPLLTVRGWVPFNELVEGDYLVGCTLVEGKGLRDPHVHHAPAKFPEVFSSLLNTGTAERRSPRDVDFHGDGEGSDVDVVVPNRFLMDGDEASSAKHLAEFFFEPTGDAPGVLKGFCSSGQGPIDLVSSELTSPKESRGSGEYLSEGRTSREANNPGFLPGAKLHPRLQESPTNVTAKLPFELADRTTFEVSANKVLKIERGRYAGHVFNLETVAGWYLASGFIAHNCYSTKRKKVLVVRFPVKGQELVTDANPGDGHVERKFLVWRVSGIEDEKTLRLIAQSVYETIGRNEFAVEIKTRNVASFGGGNLDPDILDARVGDPFDLLVNRDADHSTTTELEETMLVQESAREFLEAAGYSGGLADAYAKAYSDAGFQSTFRLRSLATEMSIEDGVSISIGGVNYVEVRADKLLPAGEELDAVGVAGSTSRQKQQPSTT